MIPPTNYPRRMILGVDASDFVLRHAALYPGDRLPVQRDCILHWQHENEVPPTMPGYVPGYFASPYVLHVWWLDTPEASNDD